MRRFDTPPSPFLLLSSFSYPDAIFPLIQIIMSDLLSLTLFLSSSKVATGRAAATVVVSATKAP